jgi:polar amino acid transport system substrate-binding protein
MERPVLPQARENARASLSWRKAALGAAVSFGTLAAAPLSAQAAAPAACAALQDKYPDWKGKTLVNAINPHTPGYETIDPKDPSEYIGFDIDLGEAIGECLGFKLTYKPVTFAALLTTLAAGQADIVISDIYATKERAKAADFITYSKVFDGVLVAKGNPKGINGINMSMCGAAAAENTGYVEVPLIQALMPECKKAGKAEPTVQLYDNNANCIQAILAGRAELCQRRQHRRQRGQGLSGQAGEGDRGDDPIFGRHRRPKGQAEIPRRRARSPDRGAEGRHAYGASEEAWARREQLQGA